MAFCESRRVPQLHKGGKNFFSRGGPNAKVGLPTAKAQLISSQHDKKRKKIASYPNFNPEKFCLCNTPGYTQNREIRSIFKFKFLCVARALGIYMYLYIGEGGREA